MSSDLLWFNLTIHRQTPKAILVSVYGDADTAFWLPKSQIDWRGPLLMNWRQVIEVPRWLAEKHELPLEMGRHEQEPPRREAITGTALPSPHEIFGLEENFDERELLTAYRKLMAKVHPDVGGTDGLAKLLNIYKDQLLLSRAKDG